MKVLVTGGSNGMGKGVGKILASVDQQTHEVILLCRSKELGHATIKEIENSSHNTKTSIVLCDLSKLSDVKAAIEEIQSKHTYLDGLFINAGIGYAAERVETEDGMDPHFQVNYLSQFMLTLNLLNLLEKSEKGGRVIFNVTEKGEIFWDDMQMKKKWHFEDGIHQAMVAKRMMLVKLHELYKIKDPQVSFTGFQISQTVWSNQINIIPKTMRFMATLMKCFGTFISIERCGEIMAPLFIEAEAISSKRSGTFITWKKGAYVTLQEEDEVLDRALQNKLWDISLDLCKDDATRLIARSLAADARLLA